jgi:hypothetical protein
VQPEGLRYAEAENALADHDRGANRPEVADGVLDGTGGGLEVAERRDVLRAEDLQAGARGQSPPTADSYGIP